MQVNKSIAGKVGIKFATPTNGTVIQVQDGSIVGIYTNFCD
jgi:hypothetical protein